MMTHEYGDPFNEETIAAAVGRALSLIERRPGEPLHVHVERAVRVIDDGVQLMRL